MFSVKTKRIYEKPMANDGYRMLVDRLWPRGVKKEQAFLDEWNKNIAPSPSLRKWFGHDPAKFDEFSRRYSRELDGKQQEIQRLKRLAGKTQLCLLYAARDELCNHAQVLAKKIMSKRFPGEVSIMKTPDNMPEDELTLRPHKSQQREPKLSSPVCYADSDEVREEFRDKLPVREMKKTKRAQNDRGKIVG